MLEINTTIHPNDEMLTRHFPTERAIFNYFQWGSEACEIIKKYQPPHTTCTIVDLACGYGRVMRYLTKTFTKAKIFGIDIQTEGIEFCSTQFGAIPIQVKQDVGVSGISIPPAQLIWSGSLLTHIDEEDADLFFKICHEALIDQTSHLIFTFHARRTQEAFRHSDTHHFHHNIDTSDKKEFLHELDTKGFAFRPYRNKKKYGITLASVPWIVNRLDKHGFDLVEYQNSGWVRQDYFVVKKRQN